MRKRKRKRKIRSEIVEQKRLCKKIIGANKFRICGKILTVVHKFCRHKHKYEFVGKINSRRFLECVYRGFCPKCDHNKA